MTHVAPEYGPELPALLRERFGLSSRATWRLVAAVLVAAAGVALFAILHDGKAELVHRGDPAFTLLYPARFDQARPGPGELARLTMREERVRAAVAVRRASLPAYRGLAVYGLAPVLAEGRLAELRRDADRTFRLRGDGRARFNGAPGYELAWRTGPPGRRVFWWEAVLVPEETERAGVRVALRVDTRGELRQTDRDLVRLARVAYRSLAFGTDRP